MPETGGARSPKEITAARNLIATSYDPEDQMRAREVLVRDPDIYNRTILEAYLFNPFLRLTQDEVATVQRGDIGPLIAKRDAVTRSPPTKYVVFCMPKSGSSFIKSALQAALQMPTVSLTSFGTPLSSSEFGMNSREQELDELAIVKSAIIHPRGFIAQHHTRYSKYLGLQMRLYGIRPLVTVRNILDCIVSFDDMLMAGKAGGDQESWTTDPQFILPLEYVELNEEVRYKILAHSYGTWLINFYLSWKRSHYHSFVSPQFIRYEDDILDRDRLIERLSEYASMSAEQEQRLRDFVHEPDKRLSRFNVGRSGRGAEKVPEGLQAFLADYAGIYRSELTDDEIQYLVR